MNRKAKKTIKRNAIKNTKVVLAALLGIETVGLAVVPTSIKKSKELKAESVTHVVGRKTSNVDGLNIALDQELNDNGDGSYTLTLKSGSSLKYEDLSVKNTKVKNGYFEAPQSGKYMIEAWGGNGAGGQSTIYSRGGNGGKGAHIYSVVELEKGDILLYTIGGDGQQTLSNDSGGGANGDGGDHGDVGSYYVGGGGGYTAVYKFTDSATFKSKYLIDDVLTLDRNTFEADRKTKYILVAGGGGGGGAGNAFSLTDKAIRTPDGGAAGDFTCEGVDISTPAFPVAGTYYAGHDGYSSGKRQDFIGKGGTSIPGAVNETFLEFFSGKYPNDWSGKPNTKYPGGSGGAGNLRGGAGGAGFAGGSGGIMTGLLVGTNVGGGGGGSSFISSELSTPEGDQLQYVTNNNESSTGGAVYITFMPTSSTFEHLQNINIETKVSKYFDVISATTDNGKVKVENNVVKAEGIVATPTIAGTPGTSTTITLKVKPVAGFMGGNDVNIFENDKVTYSYRKDLSDKTFEMALNTNCSYVNVPYAFNLETYSFTKGTDEEGKCVINFNELYKDEHYASNYDFIESVSNYKIYDGNEELSGDSIEIEVPSDQVSITKVLKIAFDVTPVASKGKAIVGEILGNKRFQDSSKITALKKSKNDLNGDEMTYNKNIAYNPEDGTYDLSLNVSTKRLSKLKNVKGTMTYTTDSVFTAADDGLYFVQLWGGTGGRGGESASVWPFSVKPGAEPGNRGYITSLIRLNEGEDYYFEIGKNGEEGNKGADFEHTGRRGGGGTGTIFYKGNSTSGTAILGAGGSGGGGGGMYTDSSAAKTGKSVDDFFTSAFNKSALAGQESGNSSSTWVLTDGGTAGKNYRNTSFKDYTEDNVFDISNFVNEDNPIVRDDDKRIISAIPAAYITYIGNVFSSDTMSGYTVTAEFTDDFKIEQTTISGATGNVSDSKDIVSNITPSISLSGDYYVFDYTVTYKLSPKETCVGGVDIKLLNSLKIEQDDVDHVLGNEQIIVSPQNETDYVNVRLNSSLLNGFNITTNSVDYVQGEEPINTSSLYQLTPGTYDSDKYSIVEPTPSDVSYNSTTDLNFSYGLENKHAPQLAVVGPVDPVLLTETSRITVHNALKYDVVGVDIDAKVETINNKKYYTFIPGQDYEAYLTASTGMVLPEENPFVVTIDGQKSVGYTYDSVTGLLTIPGEELKADSVVVISGEAETQRFTLHYLVSIDVEGYSTQEFTAKLEAGVNGEEFATVYNALINDNYPASSATKFNGYVYTIEHPVDEDGNLFTEMPAFDLWINGCYHPTPHSLTINYVDEMGSPIATVYEDSEETCYNKKDIDVVSPTIPGYAPLKVTSGSFPGNETSYNSARVQFEMPNNDVVLNVVYQSTARSVVVTYVSPLNIQLPKPEIRTGNVGDPQYSIVSPTIPGFEADIDVVSGDFTEEGVSVIVTYTPVAYKISFKESLDVGAESLFEDRNVFYMQEIGFTGESYDDLSFVLLPEPSKEGYEFKGWLMNGFFVTSLTVFNLTEDITLIPVFEQVITPVSEDDCTVVFQPSFSTYDGTNQSGPTVRVFIDQTELTLGTDFNVSFPTDMKNAGEKDVKITFIGKYSGEVHKTYIINPKDAAETISVAEIEGTFVYNGNEFKPTPEVKDGDTILGNNDFEYTYTNNIEAGTATVTVNFKGNYAATESINKTFTISPKTIDDGDSNITVSGITDPVTYTGTSFEPTLNVLFHDGEVDKTLVLGKDYIVVYGENTDAGEGTVTIKFINNYAGTPDIEKTFTINPISMTEEPTITGIDPNGYTFTGNGIEPELNITYGGETLLLGTDYTVEYFDNIHVNSDMNNPRLVISFIGNYSGENVTKTFDIHAKVVENPENNLDVIPQEYPADPIVKDGDYTLRSPEDFEVIYDGEGHGEIIFKGDYEGTDSIEFNVVVKTINISDLSVAGPQNYTFTGEQITPEDVVVKYNEYTLKDIDYILEYGENVHAGEGAGSVIIVLQGGFKAENDEKKTVYFDILAKVVEDPKDNITVEPKPYPQNPIVKDGENELRSPEDFEVIYDGEGHGEIIFKGDYEGTESIKFDIIQTEIDPEELFVAGPQDYTFTGEQIKPEDIIIVYDGTILVKGSDYTLAYGENIHAGTNGGEVYITLIGGYKSKTGEDKTVYFTILAKVVENPEDNINVIPQEYPSAPIVKDGENELRNPEDFEVIYDGEGHGEIIFKGDYEGTESIEFDIIQTTININDLDIVGPQDYTFTGEQIKPEDIEVSYEDYTLVLGLDYSLTYGENVHAGEDAGEVYITLIGGFKAENDENRTVYFSILAKVVEDPENNISVIPQVYPSNPIVKDGNYQLRSPEDFEVTYDGEGHGTVTFKGDYEGTEPISFDVVRKEVNVDDLTIDGPIDYTFTGEQIKPVDIVVTYGEVTFNKDVDYVLTYGENIHSGINAGEIYITLIGGYRSDNGKDKTVYFTILPKVVENPEDNIDVIPQEYPSAPIVKDGENELRNPEDFEVTYDGEGHGTITFKGDYEGTDSIEFDVLVKIIDISDLYVAGPQNYTFTGEQITPTDVIVQYEDYTLVKDIDYILEYGENIHTGVGAGSVVVVLQGGFKAENDETRTLYFSILPKVVENPEDNIDVIPQEYPTAPIVKDGENELRNPEDFEVIYDGEGHGEIIFKGDYEGTESIEFDIVQTTININDLDLVGPEDYTFTGEQIKPEDIEVSYEGYTLVLGLDYSLTYGENVHVGEDAGEVYITLIGGFKAENDETRTLYFTILPKVVENPEDNIDVIPQEYPTAPIVKDGENELRNPEDFEVIYDGEGHGEIIFKGDYEGTEPISFDVVRKEVNVDDLTIDGPTDYTFTGEQIKPEDIVVILDGVTLIKDIEYTLAYGENIHAGTNSGIVYITLIGGYKAENDEIKTAYFAILPKIVEDAAKDFTIISPEYPNNPIIKDGENELRCPEDFEVIYDGEGGGTITFKGDYEGNSPLTFTTVPKDIGDEVVITFETSEVPYEGEAVTPSVIVKDGDKILEEGKDYIVHYTDNTCPGVGKAIIEFIGNYSNTEIKTSEFDIKATSLDNRISAEGKATVIVSYQEGFDSDITLNAFLRETVPENVEDQAKLGGRFYGTYGDYEIKLYDGEGNEVQPSDISEGAVLTLRIELPSELEGRDVCLVHIHNEGDVSLIVRGEEAGIGTYIIDEEGYIVTLVNKFSDFSIIYEETCLAHWFLITAAILDVLLLAAIIIMGKKQQKSVGISTVVGLTVLTGVSAIFAHCTLCYVMLAINGILIIFNILFFALWKGKDEPTQAQPQVVYMQAPAQATPVSAPVAVTKEALTLKESIAQAALVETSQATMNKVTVAKWLEETYGEKVTINHRVNVTSTGLPLADTHYIEINGEKKCFIYVYQIEDKCFFIVKSDDATIEKVRSHNHTVISSAFPKTRDFAHWYTMLIDNSYANNEAVFATLKFIISRLGVAQVAAPAPAIKEEPVAAPVVEEIKADLSLKESMAEAKANVGSVEINKSGIAKFLTETYGDKVIVNTRENMTSTGLPLADTHYIYLGENKKCFIYVYEVDGKCFCIVRSDDETAKEVKGLGHKFVSSAFPKTRDYAKWFTMLFDESYKSNEEVYSTLKLVIDRLSGVKTAVVAPKEETVIEEPAKADLSLKESISEAKETVSELSINKEVIAKYLSAKYGKQVIVNTRENMTSTGLPLADTHYLYIGEDKKCFIYVYDIDGSCFFIVRGNDEIAKAVKDLKHKFISSAFPKTRDYAKWYTMLIDGSYKSNEAVFEALDVVISGLLGKTISIKEEPAIEEPVKADLSLKESIAEAKAHESKLEINKKVVAEYLEKTFGKKVVVNTRENMTSTGLPLADTHYLYMGENKKCFIYVYDLEGKCFFIVRGNDEVVKGVKALKHKIISSAFPKTRDYAKWYTMIIDDSYESNDDVFKALDAVVNALLGGGSSIEEIVPVVEEAEMNDLSLKESMAKAAEVKANVEMNKVNIANWLKETYGDKVTVNIRESMTSTGLPLADTHYIEIDGVKKCFIYIYELNGNCFAIVRSDEETAKEVRKAKHKFISSAFPKTRDYAKWYTMLFDESYKSSSEVFETLSKVIKNIKLK